MIPIINQYHLSDNDSIIFFDYRSDRMRQVAETFGIQRNFESEVSHPHGLVKLSYNY